jgi:hypothetical protein
MVALSLTEHLVAGAGLATAFMPLLLAPAEAVRGPLPSPRTEHLGFCGANFNSPSRP